jgi:hypothetical protein
MTRKPTDLIAHYETDGTLILRSRKGTLITAFAEALAPSEGRIPVMKVGEPTRMGWEVAGRSIRQAATKLRA